MKFMFSQSLVQVPVKYVSVQCRGGLITVLYGIYALGKWPENSFVYFFGIGSRIRLNNQICVLS